MIRVLLLYVLIGLLVAIAAGIKMWWEDGRHGISLDAFIALAVIIGPITVVLWPLVVLYPILRGKAPTTKG